MPSAFHRKIIHSELAVLYLTVHLLLLNSVPVHLLYTSLIPETSGGILPEPSPVVSNVQLCVFQPETHPWPLKVQTLAEMFIGLS